MNQVVSEGSRSSASMRPRHSHILRSSPIDWIAIEAHPRFQELHRRKSRFLWGLMAFSVLYYFLLPVGAAYWTELFRRQVWGPVNIGLVFALSEFIVAWFVAFIYSRHASRHFDAMAADLRSYAREATPQ